ncbi:MAG TPA: HAD hydrolase-like protein [Baekduia sp.]|uniref:HAD hydrolase-like protein n=1 Tax=Baekduia sp. TaxID=2600305 RepID=UPI002D159EE2|nr:HAD hydrolase-like protein [Baekduia sp.]HMJ32631.1 HAD hydrolase-like protein [Baekduia sp.]
MDLSGTDAVLFDLDGVLVDSRTAFTRSMNAALAEHGLPERPDGELHPFLGPPLHRTFATLAAEAGAGEDVVEGLVLSYRARYRATAVAESAVFPGMAEALEQLAVVMPLVVATSKSQALAEPLLEQLGLRRYFQAIHGPSLQARDEAKSLTIARALEGLPHARRAVMVGDRKFDVLGARAHDLPCVGVLWGIGSERELREAGALVLVEEPSDLPELFGA